MNNGGQTHLHTASAPVNCQFLRLWGSTDITLTSTAGGLETPVNTVAVGSGRVGTPVLNERNTWIVQAAYRSSIFPTGAGSENVGIYFKRDSGATEQLSVRIRKQGASASGSFQDGERFKIEVMRGATSLGISRDFWSRSWHVIQVKVFFNDPGGAPNTGTVEVRVLPLEGEDRNRGQAEATQETVINVAGIDTSDSGQDGVDVIELDYDASTGTVTWDHFLVMDSDGAQNNDFPAQPLVYVHGGVPNRDGADNDWVPQGPPPDGFEAVNDRADLCTEDDGRYTSDNPTDVLLFGMQPPGQTGTTPANASGPRIGASNAVLGVMFHHVSAMESSGNRTVRSLYRDIADVRSEGPDVVLSGTTFGGFFEIFELEPITAAVWTAQQTLDMQWGLKLQA